MDEKQKQVGEEVLGRLKADFGIDLHRVDMDFHYVHVGVEPGTVASCYDKMDSRVIPFHLDVEAIEAHVVFEAHVGLVPARLGDWVHIYLVS